MPCVCLGKNKNRAQKKMQARPRVPYATEARIFQTLLATKHTLGSHAPRVSAEHQTLGNGTTQGKSVMLTTSENPAKHNMQIMK